MLSLDIYGNTNFLKQRKVAQIESPPPRPRPRPCENIKPPPRRPENVNRRKSGLRTLALGRTTYGAKCIARVERKICEPFFSSPRQKSRCTQRILFVGKCPLIIPTARRPRSLGLSSHSGGSISRSGQRGAAGRRGGGNEWSSKRSRFLVHCQISFFPRPPDFGT